MMGVRDNLQTDIEQLEFLGERTMEATRFEDVIARHIRRLLGRTQDRYTNRLIGEQARQGAIHMVRDLIDAGLVPLPDGTCDRPLLHDYDGRRCGMDPYHQGACRHRET